MSASGQKQTCAAHKSTSAKCQKRTLIWPGKLLYEIAPPHYSTSKHPGIMTPGADITVAAADLENSSCHWAPLS